MAEARYVNHHRKKLAFFLAAMRAFARELREAGWRVDYVALDDPKNTGSLTGEVERAVAGLPGLNMRPIEATYLAWIDAREFAADRGIADVAKFFEERGLGLSDGADFGAPGFVRLNFGTRRALLDDALARLAAAVRA